MELKLGRLGDGIAGPKLLIVPYGIETDRIQGQLRGFQSFNRTLWN